MTLLANTQSPRHGSEVPPLHRHSDTDHHPECNELLHAGPPAPSDCPDGHEWVVFSTASRDVCLMVQCVNCGSAGSVDDSSKEEWSEAFYAPTNPYGWDDGSRVTVRGRGPLYVLKAGDVRGEPAPSEQPEGTVG